MAQFQPIQSMNQLLGMLPELLSSDGKKALLPMIGLHWETISGLVQPAIAMFEGLRSQGHALSSTAHGRGKRRREVITSKALGECFRSLASSVTVDAIVMVGGTWISADGELLRDFVGHHPYRQWPSGGISFEMVTYATENPELLKQKAEAVALSFLDHTPPQRDDNGSETLAYEMLDDAGSNTEAFILDFCSEGERTVAAIALLNEPVPSKKLEGTRLYFQALLHLCGLLVRAERYRERGESLVNQMHGKERIEPAPGAIKGSDRISEVFKDMISSEIKKFCTAAANLFEVEEVRVFLPGQGDDLSVCVTSNRSRPHLIRLARRHTTGALPYNAASVSTWHNPATAKEIQCTCLVHSSSERPLMDHERDIRVYATNTVPEKIVSEQHDDDIATIIGLDHLDASGTEGEETRRRILAGPTLLVYRNTPLPYLDPKVSGLVDPVVMFLGRNLDRRLLNINDSASTHANRIDRIRAYSDSFLTNLMVLIRSYLSEWRRAGRRRIVTYKDESEQLVAIARRNFSRSRRNDMVWPLLCKEIAAVLDAKVVSIFDFVPYGAKFVLKYRKSSLDDTEAGGEDAGDASLEELREKGDLYFPGPDDLWLTGKSMRPPKGIYHDSYDRDRRAKVGFGNWSAFRDRAEQAGVPLDERWNTGVIPLTWRKRLVGLLRVDGAPSLFQSVLANASSSFDVEAIPNVFPRHLEPTLVDLSDVLSSDLDRGIDGIKEDLALIARVVQGNLGIDVSTAEAKSYAETADAQAMPPAAVCEAWKQYYQWVTKDLESLAHAFNASDPTVRKQFPKFITKDGQ